MRFTISPDENPGDPGSIAADGTTERSVNLEVCYALHHTLLRCQQDVLFEPTLTFERRVAIANADGTSVLVACAHNESTPGLSGTQFVFCPGGPLFGKQQLAASHVYTQLARIPGWPQRRSDVIKQIYECCVFDGDTVYIELLFMSPDDRHLWSSPDYPQLAAEAIARGLADTYGFTYTPLPGAEPVQLAISEEAHMQTTTRPDGGTDTYVLMSDRSVVHLIEDATGQATKWEPIPGTWLATVRAGYRGATAFFRGLGTDTHLWEITVSPGDNGWQGPNKLI